jgi:hypothetical protein
MGPKRKVKWRVLPKSWRHRLNPEEVLDLYQQGIEP